jgi:hypothetical protein
LRDAISDFGRLVCHTSLQAIPTKRCNLGVENKTLR